MRKITVLKVLAIEIVFLILLKEETGVDYVVTIDKCSYRRQSLWLKLLIFGFYNNVENLPYKKVLLKTM